MCVGGGGGEAGRQGGYGPALVGGVKLKNSKGGKGFTGRCVKSDQLGALHLPGILLHS